MKHRIKKSKRKILDKSAKALNSLFAIRNRQFVPPQSEIRNPKLFFLLIVCVLFSALGPVSAHAARVKDIATIKGIRDNSLIGYGLVIGLSGTGDKIGTRFTVQSLSSMLKKMGITVNAKAVKVKNVAGVMVTAKLPPFVRAGSRIDVLVSSLGDAKSLQGGTLLLTPLKGPDQKVYAVAQGPVSIGGFIGGGGGNTVQKNHPTAGRIADGALVEREVPNPFTGKDKLTLLLRQQDFTTALRVSHVINAKLGHGAATPPIATPIDSGAIQIDIPGKYRGRLVELLALIEGLEVQVDVRAKVVVNERTGTIVMGNRVRISDVAVSHGNLTIQVRTNFEVSQPAPFSSKGETVVVPQQETLVTEEEAKISLLSGGTTIGQVIRGLNAIGVTPRDLIAILQALKAAGALQAQLEIL